MSFTVDAREVSSYRGSYNGFKVAGNSMGDNDMPAIPSMWKPNTRCKISFQIKERMQYLLHNERLPDRSEWSSPDSEQAIIVAKDDICEVAISYLPIFSITSVRLRSTKVSLDPHAHSKASRSGKRGSSLHFLACDSEPVDPLPASNNLRVEFET